MISFYPGPSKVYEEVPTYVKEAYEKGILSINHRSREFAKILEHTYSLLKEKLDIPKEYGIYFVSSATECWEIIAQSLIQERSFHLFNGAFGEKWHYYTQKLHKNTSSYIFNMEDVLVPEAIEIPKGTELVCFTQNETSNGTQISNEVLQKFRKANPDKLIAVDATSSLAGIKLDMKQADVWYASVQKCFGLPSGMAVLICSPAAIETAFHLGKNRHYNSLTFLHENYLKLETAHTPNILNIYLLMKVMEKSKGIDFTDEQINRRYDSWENFISNFSNIRPLVSNNAARSKTVITLKAEAEKITEIKSKALEAGLLLGNGYGKLKDTTFRIANFPAITENEISQLKDFLRKQLS